MVSTISLRRRQYYQLLPPYNGMHQGQRYHPHPNGCVVNAAVVDTMLVLVMLLLLDEIAIFILFVALFVRLFVNSSAHHYRIRNIHYRDCILSFIIFTHYFSIIFAVQHVLWHINLSITAAPYENRLLHTNLARAVYFWEGDGE